MNEKKEFVPRRYVTKLQVGLVGTVIATIVSITDDCNQRAQRAVAEENFKELKASTMSTQQKEQKIDSGFIGPMASEIGRLKDEVEFYNKKSAGSEAQYLGCLDDLSREKGQLNRQLRQCKEDLAQWDPYVEK